jgi:hypothetical protein
VIGAKERAQLMGRLTASGVPVEEATETIARAERLHLASARIRMDVLEAVTGMDGGPARQAQIITLFLAFEAEDCERLIESLLDTVIKG